MKKRKNIDYKSFIVLVFTPIAALFLVPYYAIVHKFCSTDWIWFIFFMVSTGLSITMGYHRLWSHCSYKANILIRAFFMLFGACAIQNSIIKWCSDHRNHHKFVDNKKMDPYAATKGFWYSHILWMLKKSSSPIKSFENVQDLKRDPLVVFQDRYYIFIAIFMCVILPMIIGATYDHTMGCLLLAGLLRLVLNHHLTFFINSLAHIWGRQKYSSGNTSKDNILLSFFTYGEGYHNFHHKYPGDYRNGIRWYDFDPSKWFVFLFSFIGWTYNLKITASPIIEAAKATMENSLESTLTNAEL
jgi:stearoyl-CoA desaturase (delta-9 desaturase)